MDYLSVSKIHAYEQCPACFYKQYISDDGITNDGSNFFTVFGSILHEVVELASRYYTDNGVIVDPITIYDDVWKNHNLSDFNAYKEGKTLIVITSYSIHYTKLYEIRQEFKCSSKIIVLILFNADCTA